MCKISGIYKITSPSNRVYIGQSIDIIKRFKKYKSLDSSCKSQKLLWNSLIKHGIENHTYEIVEFCIKDFLNERERYWQDYYDVLDNTKGLNCILTETKEKVRVISPETRAKYSEWQKNGKNPKGMLGKKHTKENIEYFRKMNKGRTFSSETILKMSLSRFGKKASEETKAKMRGKRYSVNGRKVININTLEVFDSINLAALHYGLNKGTLAARLSGRLENNTDIRYYKQFLKQQINGQIN